MDELKYLSVNMVKGIPKAAYIEVKIVSAQSIESLLQAVFGVVLVRVPELASDEDLLSGNSTVLDALSDLVFVPIDPASGEQSSTMGLSSCYKAASIWRYPSFRAKATALRTSPGSDFHVPS